MGAARVIFAAPGDDEADLYAAAHQEPGRAGADDARILVDGKPQERRAGAHVLMHAVRLAQAATRHGGVDELRRERQELPCPLRRDADEFHDLPVGPRERLHVQRSGKRGSALLAMAGIVM
jgi:hypothetical protein